MNTKTKQYLVKQLLKYPKLFEFVRKHRKILIPRTFSCVVSYEQASTYTKKLAKIIPNEFDVIVGIPRSGLFVADIIATKFGRPLTTPDLFIKNEFWENALIRTPKIIKKVLIVDDSVGEGTALKKAKEKLLEFDPKLIIKTASPFSLTSGKDSVDYVLFIKKPDCVFEWQIIHGSKYTTLSCDMDGVLCEDCPWGINLMEEEYIHWMQNAKPFMIPINKIDTIITSRLEKYRKITETWLKKNNVKYKNLIMLNLGDDYNKTLEVVIKFKSAALKKYNSDWFWESDFRQAFEINKNTKIPILCTKEMVLLDKKGKKI